MSDHLAHATRKEAPTSSKLGQLNVAVGNISLQGNASGNFGYTHIENNYQSPHLNSIRDACLQSLAFPQMRIRDGIRETPGTCEWVLHHKQYQDWNKEGGVLWIRGRPGTGKSTVMQYALEHHQLHGDVPNTTLVGSFFFHRRGNELQYTRLGLFRSLLHQILRTDQGLLDRFLIETKFEDRHRKEGKPGKQWYWTEREIQIILEIYMEAFLQTRPIRLYIDALDEAGESHARGILSDFAGLAKKDNKSKPRLSICYSCRPYPVVMSGYDFLIDVDKSNGPDITTYVDQEFMKAPAFRTCKDPVLNRRDMHLVKVELVKRASGVFQWVSLVTVEILKLHGERKETIIDRIQHIPQELGDLYEDMIHDIGEADQKLALNIFRWISFARRPLSPRELHHAIARDAPLEERESSADWDGRTFEMEQTILRLSRGLAKVVESTSAYTKPATRTVQFDHESVKEYMSKRGIEFLEVKCQQINPAGSVLGRAHFTMSRCCIKYLKGDWLLAMRNRVNFRDIVRDSPFFLYALCEWGTHAKIAEVENMSQGDLVDLTKWPSTWLQDLNHLANFSDGNELYGKRDWSLEHFACHHGLYSTVKELVNRLETKQLHRWGLRRWYAQHQEARKIRRRWNVRSERWGQDPLSLAAESGHEKIVNKLLSIGKVNVNSKSLTQQTPLSYAAEKGHEGVVIQLLSIHKVDPEPKDDYGQTPLSEAAGNGHDKVVRQLLSTYKVDPNSRDEQGRTPLSDAAGNGHDKVVKQLLSTYKVDPDSRDEEGRTPLSDAAEEGHDQVVRQLLSTYKVDPDSRDEKGRTPLSHAAEEGHDKVVRQLLSTDKVDPDSKSERGRTPLSYAAGNGHDKVVRQLLGTNQVDPDSRDEKGRTPLSDAAEEGHNQVVRQLLGTGKVDVNLTDRRGRSALSLAAEGGHTRVVQELLSLRSICVDSKDDFGRTPLFHAAGGGHEHTVKQLLDTGRVDIRSKAKNDWTALSYADHWGHEKVVKQLQDYQQQIRQ